MFQGRRSTVCHSRNNMGVTCIPCCRCVCTDVHVCYWSSNTCKWYYFYRVVSFWGWSKHGAPLYATQFICALLQVYWRWVSRRTTRDFSVCWAPHQIPQATTSMYPRQMGTVTPDRQRLEVTPNPLTRIRTWTNRNWSTYMHNMYTIVGLTSHSNPYLNPIQSQYIPSFLDKLLQRSFHPSNRHQSARLYMYVLPV